LFRDPSPLRFAFAFGFGFTVGFTVGNGSPLPNTATLPFGFSLGQEILLLN